MDDGVEVQWRCVWFPPDTPDKTLTGTEEKVRAKFAEMKEAGYCPIIDRREVGPWELVESA